MSLSTQSLLDSVDTAITARLNGDAYEEWAEGSQKFKGATLRDLYRMRSDLKNQVAAEGGGQFRGLRLNAP